MFKNTLFLSLILTIGLVLGSAVLASAQTAITVDITSPSGGTNFEVGQTISFSANVAGGSGLYSYIWNFGDGTQDGSETPTKDYSKAGDYNVTLTITDTSSQQASDTVAITVVEEEAEENDETLTVSISSPVAGSSYDINETISFSANVAGGSGLYSYIWNFGDGTQDGSETPSKTYDEAGNYTVTLTVTDTTDNQVSGSVAITINSADDDTPTPTKPVISNIHVTDVGQTTATIRWTTDKASNSRVIYDTVSRPTIDLDAAPNFGYASSSSTSDNDPKVTEHAVTLTGLLPNTTYFFRVLSQ